MITDWFLFVRQKPVDTEFVSGLLDTRRKTEVAIFTEKLILDPSSKYAWVYSIDYDKNTSEDLHILDQEIRMIFRENKNHPLCSPSFCLRLSQFLNNCSDGSGIKRIAPQNLREFLKPYETYNLFLSYYFA